MSAPRATAAGFREASNTPERLLGGDTGRVTDIRQVGSRQVYANRWMTLREDDIRLRDGRSGVYAVVDKPDYALVIARDRDRFRLVEQYRYPIGLRRWEFPQGTAPDLADLEPEALAARELREETGLRAGRLRRLGQLDVAPGMSSQRGWVFLATDLTEGEHDREPEEQDMHSAWFERSEVEAMIRSGQITDAQSIAAWTLFLLHERTAPLY
ncbi:NUDIX hydrolase [Mycolicibacterium thermoresistibile]|nr:NUDIX hydrolase [Mycolicibacterium thermoresistibile]